MNMKAELFNFKCWINESDSEEIKRSLASFLSQSGFTILGFIDHQFSPQGYTCVWLLSESHLAVHTYPEHNKSYVELTSCVEQKLEDFKACITNAYELV